MPKLRVYQLARELNLDNSEIIRELQHMGVPVTSHSNTVEDRLADQLGRSLERQPHLRKRRSLRPLRLRKKSSRSQKFNLKQRPCPKLKNRRLPHPHPKLKQRSRLRLHLKKLRRLSSNLL